MASAPSAFARAQSASKGARIAGEIFVRAELRRVHEDGYGDVPACCGGTRISDACPACSAPIVGTRPTTAPSSSWDAWRAKRDHRRNSSTVRSIRISAFCSAGSITLSAACSRDVCRSADWADGSSPHPKGRRGAPRPRDSARRPRERARQHRHSGEQTSPGREREVHKIVEDENLPIAIRAGADANGGNRKLTGDRRSHLPRNAFEHQGSGSGTLKGVCIAPQLRDCFGRARLHAVAAHAVHALWRKPEVADHGNFGCSNGPHDFDARPLDLHGLGAGFLHESHGVRDALGHRCRGSCQTACRPPPARDARRDARRACGAASHPRSRPACCHGPARPSPASRPQEPGQRRLHPPAATLRSRRP